LATAAPVALGLTVAALSSLASAEPVWSRGSASNPRQSPLEHDARPRLQASSRSACRRSGIRNASGATSSSETEEHASAAAQRVVGFVFRRRELRGLARATLADIDVVIPDWFELPGPDATFRSGIDDKTRRVLRRSTRWCCPASRTFPATPGEARDVALSSRDDANRACVVKKLVKRLRHRAAA